jgi:phage terminase small subunit
LTKPLIQSFLTEIQKDLEKIAGISRLRVVQELERIAFSSIAHLHLTWVTRKEFEDLTSDQKASIQQIETQTKTLFTETGDKFEVEFVKIKLYDKMKAMDTLNRMLGYNAAEKVEHAFVESQIVKIGGQEIPFD